MVSDGPTTCCGKLRDEFRFKKLDLNHNDPSLFVKPQCFKPVIYIFWVVFWVVFYMVNLGLEVYYYIDLGPLWFIYLTNLTYLIQSTSIVLDCGVTLYVHLRQKEIRDGLSDSLPAYFKVLWVLFNISNTGSILVTVLYYASLNPEFTHGSINTHMLNSVYTVLLLLFTAKPVQILHVYQPLIYAILFILFTVIYHEAGNDRIYYVLDWDKPGSTATFVVLGLLVGVPVGHLFCFGLYTLRLFIWRESINKVDPSLYINKTTTKTDLNELNE